MTDRYDQVFQQLCAYAAAVNYSDDLVQTIEQLLVFLYCQRCDTITETIDLARARAIHREETIRKYFGAIRYPEKK